MRNLAVLVLVGVVLGCGSIPSVLPKRDARCELRPGSAQCTDLRDFQGPSFAAFQGVCETLIAASDSVGKYEEDARCDTTESWGGCQSTSLDGTQQTNWYYKGQDYPTEAEARAECDSGQTFVTP